ncbi:hypothetical protein [Streptomyces smyrnaeus]|uniref:hypothetical protein n=1 Tax=Streptomyces smyrnaeus TaxID=1387713 RepID=UPI001620203F
MLTGERAPDARTVWCGRVLLLAALLFGLVTMHTLGHVAPEEGMRETPAAAEHLSAAPAPDPAPAPAPDPGPAHHQAVPEQQPAPEHGDGHGTGTDPLSLCLAVLGIWTAAALLGAVATLVARGRGSGLLRPYRCRAVPALWPLPPRRTATRLAQLSILRM